MSDIASYIWGFVLSVILTLTAFLLVWYGTFPREFLYVAIVMCAVLQLGVQLFLFLHLGRRGNTMNRMMLLFAAILVFIVVGGALWIMTSLNARMMPSQDQMMQYMQNQDDAM